jgi:hypothetical protein
MSLIVPGTRSLFSTGPVPVDFAYIVGIEIDGNTVVLPADSRVHVQRAPEPDDIYGAISLILMEDGIAGMILLFAQSDAIYESAFMVMRMASGKVLLSPDLNMEVSSVREPSKEHVFSSLSVLHANITAVKTIDMLAGASAISQRMSQDEQLKQQLGL